ncbi:hypothetical protein ACIHCQ_30940 [Streptomyces sp. NPDC052236]|uniref:hypothetical protein n=1 Tax=Streptomyces sp. NPDC052236 TaxID=3365686 RepID=UPI0037D6E113
MPEDNPNLKAQYANQVAADLEQNATEQERIKSEAAALQSRLETLQKDQELLTGVQEALGGAPVKPAKATKAAKTAAVPKARRASAVADKAKRPKKAAEPKADAKPKAVAKSKSAGPPLRELVVALLAEHQEPRSAAEVTKELEKAHPERTLNVTLVRNALEASVAKNQSERTKQQNSVYYSAIKGNTAQEEPSAALSAADA